MMPETRRKWGNTLQNVGDVAHNAKPNFPIEAIHRKYTFFQAFLLTSGCNKCLQGGTCSMNLEGQKDSFSKFCIHAALKIMLPNEGGEHFSQKNDEKSVEKSGLNRINTNGTVDGTRNAHPRGPKKQKYTFLQWILQILMCNRYRHHGTFSVTLGWQNDFFCRFCLHATFKIMLPT